MREVFVMICLELRFGTWEVGLYIFVGVYLREELLLILAEEYLGLGICWLERSSFSKRCMVLVIQQMVRRTRYFQ